MILQMLTALVAAPRAAPLVVEDVLEDEDDPLEVDRLELEEVRDPVVEIVFEPVSEEDVVEEVLDSVELVLELDTEDEVLVAVDREVVEAGVEVTGMLVVVGVCTGVVVGFVGAVVFFFLPRPRMRRSRLSKTPVSVNPALLTAFRAAKVSRLSWFVS